ncbi:ATP-dependent DNA helicase PIF1 [Paramuricea clavata]|uniref:ATP-dependent DNA helicase PIF1 n=1 Tax=Paramuricea clavata TaxID=317549 RepID=A0A7D9HI01_PARCT|nr:ATP-dependent DNA helicase PIF1 [Paramuricea clavata]
MANDVEENPGPTVYDVVDPTKTICADFSQGNTKKFRQNAGKQCLAMSLTAIIYSHITNANAWDSTVLNSILCAGNNLYSFISNSVNKSYLLLTDVPEMVSVFDGIYCMQYGEPCAGDLFMENTTLPYYSIEGALNNPFTEAHLNYQHCMLTIGCNTVAIFKTSEGTFKRAAETEIEKQTRLGNAKVYRKAKRALETEHEKQSRRQNARNYKKAKQAAETETQKQTRLENAREYRKAKQASETEHEKQTTLGDVINHQSANQNKRKRLCASTQIINQQDYLNKFDIEKDVPTELQNLTQVEEMLIARALPIMRVYIKLGGQRGYSGHCVNLPQNVKELATSLPRYPKDLSVIIVKVKSKDNSFRDVSVRREKVHNALLWFVQNHYAEL